MFLFFRSVLLFNLLLIFSDEAKAERIYGQLEPPRFEIGRLALKMEVDRFSSESNYNHLGKKDANLAGNFEAYNAYLGVENDISLYWAGSMGLLLGRSSSEVVGESRQNMDIKGIQFGLNRKLDFLKDERIPVVADLKLFIKFYDVSYGSDEVSLGDGENWLQGGFWFGSDSLEYLRIWLYGGLRWPLDRMSKNLVYSFTPEIKLAKGRLGAGLEGELPLIDDKDKGEPTQRLQTISGYNGGSFYYHSINKKYLAGMIWFGFEPFPLTEIKIGLSDILSGTSAHQGLRVFMNVELAFSVTASGFGFPYFKLKKSNLKKKSGQKRLKNYANPKRR